MFPVFFFQREEERRGGRENIERERAVTRHYQSQLLGCCSKPEEFFVEKEEKYEIGDGQAIYHWKDLAKLVRLSLLSRESPTYNAS